MQVCHPLGDSLLHCGSPGKAHRHMQVTYRNAPRGTDSKIDIKNKIAEGKDVSMLLESGMALRQQTTDNIFTFPSKNEVIKFVHVTMG